MTAAQGLAAEETHEVLSLVRMKEQIEVWEATGDRRVIFLACYAAMTANMLEALETGVFRDGPWVGHLLAHFSNFYFNALEAYETRLPTVPPAWRYAHDLALARFTSVEEDLILGINAHINGDLAFAVRDLLLEEWASLDEAGRSARYEDFNSVNRVIGKTTTTVQHDVVDRYDHLAGMVDRLMPPAMGLIDWTVDTMLSGWREDVWRWATRLLDASRQPDLEAEVTQGVHTAAVHRVHVITFELEERQRLLTASAEELARIYSAFKGPWLRGLRDRHGQEQLPPATGRT